MVAQSTLSYRQLYKLFGYNKELDLEAIINELLYSISDVKYIETSPACDLSRSDVFATVVFPYHVFDKKNVKPYLEHQTGTKFLLRMDARLHALYLKRKELKKLRWFNIFKWVSLRREISKLSSQLIAVKDVFAFFAYKAKRMGISVNMLHKKITDAAETYSPYKDLIFSM